jgi:hypothetical protein
MFKNQCHLRYYSPGVAAKETPDMLNTPPEASN